MLKSHICFNNKTLQRKNDNRHGNNGNYCFNDFFAKKYEFCKVLKEEEKKKKKKKEKNPTQDFRDFSVGRERANKHFYFFLPNIVCPFYAHSIEYMIFQVSGDGCSAAMTFLFIYKMSNLTPKQCIQNMIRIIYSEIQHKIY